MLSITKKIAIAASLVAFCSGQLYASDLADPAKMETLERQRQAIAAVVYNPEVLEKVLEKASMSVNPATFHLVCRFWKQTMDAKNHPEERQLFKKQGFFMKRCMKIWWNNEGSGTSLGQFYNGQLVYKRGTPEAKITLFSSLEDPFKGTLDLSAFGDTGNYLVITTDEERFREIRGKNENKVVILSMLRQVVEEESKKDPNHPLSKFLAGWDKKAKVGLFYKWGNADLTRIDYLTTATLSEISSRNLFENWSGTRSCTMSGAVWVVRSPLMHYVCVFCKPK